ncbi:hypothetical protein AKJ41_02730 [candidate division MSBL1 archaeon SCGC-AAA259O05]|uniref:Uroporphyrinogen decarboxylase (URO-D) domain-containing protein n=1 Tax=candidate division MSBL1 archaeon SCGC-AAA259O05 TaxID=1698271 RepID=A0A133V3U3_9EURY|nr:hypothetical protein AKJ41_02730 [candidate division MSBL1 archaeon SCGC-AAA259O05]
MINFQEFPSPNFDDLKGILRGEKEPERVHFVEFTVDPEMIIYILENYTEESIPPLTRENRVEHMDKLIDFYSMLGYDSVNIGGLDCFRNLPEFRARILKDTADLSRGERTWVEEGGGIIKDWKDFEEIKWDDIKPDLNLIDKARKELPEGMKLTVWSSLFEVILERFFGYEDLFKFSVQKPNLVEAVFEKWGEKVYEWYKRAVEYSEVGAFFHADDLGYKNNTMLSPQFLRKNVFPWFKKYVDLAHENDLMYWYHCCGNALSVMEDLIKDVNIDAFHSFQDQIMPVSEFINRYGDRVAALGGIDVDKLARMNTSELRKYVQKTLKDCMPGKYALGSGNSVTNYVPPENYIAMLEEALKWR